MRLFTALDLPDAVRDHCASLQSPDALDARWSPAEQFHVTVRFIGDANANRAARYEEALANMNALSVECVPYGLDVLPSHRNPSVLIMGLKRTDDLMAVYRAVSDALESEGLEPEHRDYRPHVTLARLDDVPPASVRDVLDDNSDVSPPSFSVDTLTLYESTLTSDGAVHERRASFPLGS